MWGKRDTRAAATAHYSPARSLGRDRPFCVRPHRRVKRVSGTTARNRPTQLSFPPHRVCVCIQYILYYIINGEIHRAERDCGTWTPRLRTVHSLLCTVNTAVFGTKLRSKKVVVTPEKKKEKNGEEIGAKNKLKTSGKFYTDIYIYGTYIDERVYKHITFFGCKNLVENAAK